MGALRRHWRIPVVSTLLAVLAVGVFLFTRNEITAPTRYRTDAVVLVPSDNPETGKPVTGVPQVLLRNPIQLATAVETQARAFEVSDLPATGSGVTLTASISHLGDNITLSAIARSAATAQTVASNYVDAFVEARRDASASAAEANKNALLTTMRTLRTRLADVETTLERRIGPLDPIIVNDPNDEDRSTVTPRFVLPNSGLDTVLLVFERFALYERITQLQFEYADAAVESLTPRAFVDVASRGLTRRVTAPTSSPATPTAALVLVGLFVGLAAAVVIDRLDRSIRTAPAAAAALSAPVLATIPGRGGNYIDLRAPTDARSEAYRTLGATSLATDRLPQAIMVTSPEGDVHHEVAANFAAALAGLGVRVALVATAESQHWFAEPFHAPPEGVMTLPDLLAQAHAGRLNGEIPQRLAVTDLTPNLVLVEPGADTASPMSLDGLPPFLDALTRAGIEVTVIAGPPLLEDSNATILAWATRHVLWVVEAGKLSEAAARAAAERLQLAGVRSFGVVLVGDDA